eukprot:TRINITY_DN8470_c0_g1_i3.p1 TRINITY_DN8470_c0_g1~~TRINITY_DN8470_c0_g1_i3.p1  ORF type:complete len:326 (-),score=22.34 TRINITY_DN8470_c0_g1_i3:530-1447(-)
MMMGAEESGPPTSLHDIFTAYPGASLLLVSAPEYGARMDDPSAHDVPVMRICESLHERLAPNITFTIGVDFKDSTSGQFCSSRVRSTNPLMYGKDDFDMDLTEACQEERPPLPTCSARMRMATENSFWISYWRGQVSGCLLTAIMSANESPKCEKSVMALIEGPHDYVGYEYISGETGAPSLREPQRVVVVTSIEGGPITQVEKTQIPSVCTAVLANLQRRQYSWAWRVCVMWCHFPCVEGFIESLAGRRNLKIVNPATAPIHVDKYCNYSWFSDAAPLVSKGSLLTDTQTAMKPLPFSEDILTR